MVNLSKKTRIISMSSFTILGDFWGFKSQSLEGDDFSFN